MSTKQADQRIQVFDLVDMNKENESYQISEITEISSHPVGKEETVIAETAESTSDDDCSLPVCFWCKYEYCPVACEQLDVIMDHFRTCVLGPEGGCDLCNEPVIICGAHALTCKDQECSVSFIAYYKAALKQHQQKHQKDQLNKTI